MSADLLERTCFVKQIHSARTVAAGPGVIEGKAAEAGCVPVDAEGKKLSYTLTYVNYIQYNNQ